MNCILFPGEFEDGIDYNNQNKHQSEPSQAGMNMYDNRIYVHFIAGSMSLFHYSFLLLSKSSKV